DPVGARRLAGRRRRRFGLAGLGVEQRTRSPVAGALLVRTFGVGVRRQLVEEDDPLSRMPFGQVRPEETEEGFRAQIALEMVIDDVLQQHALAGVVTPAP